MDLLPVLKGFWAKAQVSVMRIMLKIRPLLLKIRPLLAKTRQFSKKTWIIIFIVTFVLGSFAWVGIQKRLMKYYVAKAQAQGLHFPVEVAHAKKGTISDALRLVGNVRADEEVVLKPEIAGKIVGFGFKEGEQVASGTALIRLDPAIYQAQLDQAKASLRLSEQSYARAQSLNQKNVGSISSVDEARAKMESDQATVELAQANLAKATISAPFAGEVGIRTVTVGDYVQPGQALATIVANDPMKVDFRVPESESASVKVGQKVSVTVDAYLNETFEGEVDAIDSALDAEGRSLLVRAKVPNPDNKLKAGLFAEVTLTVNTKEQALLLSEGALIPSAEKTYVYIVDAENKIVRREVKTGLHEDNWVEVLDGVTEQDRVVQSGQFKLYEGAIVEVPEGQ